MKRAVLQRLMSGFPQRIDCPMFDYFADEFAAFFKSGNAALYNRCRAKDAWAWSRGVRDHMPRRRGTIRVHIEPCREALSVTQRSSTPTFSRG